MSSDPIIDECNFSEMRDKGFAMDERRLVMKSLQNKYEYGNFEIEKLMPPINGTTHEE